MTADHRQLRQDGEHDVAQLKMIVNQKLRLLHERLDVLLDRVGVLRARERLYKHALALLLLDLFDSFRVDVELFQVLQRLVRIPDRLLQVVQQHFKGGHLRGRPPRHVHAACGRRLSEVFVPLQLVSRLSLPLRIGLVVCRLKEVDAALVVVHFDGLREVAHNFVLYLRVLLEWVVLEIQHAQGLELLELLNKVHPLLVRKLDQVIAEVHFHHVLVVAALVALQLQLRDSIRVQIQNFELGHLAQDRHLLQKVVSQIQFLQIGQLQVDLSDEVALGDDDLQLRELVQVVDVVELVLREVNLQEVAQAVHFLEVAQILQLHLAQIKHVRVLK